MGAIKEFGVNLVANVSGFQRSMQQAAKASQKFRKDLGDSVSKIAKMGAPLGAFAVNAVRASVSFEDAFAGVRKTVDASEEEFEALRKTILKMSTELPAGANSIAKVMENAAQLGVSGSADLEKFTRTMIDLSESTNITAEEGSIALAQFANAVQMPLSEIDRLGSVIVGLGNTMATTEADILEFSTRISGTGKTAGLSAGQIVGFSAALSSVGLNAEAGATAFNKMVKSIQRSVSLGGESLEQFAIITQTTSEQFAETFRKAPQQAILDFLNGLARIKEEGGDLIVLLDQMGMSEQRLADTILRSVVGIDKFNMALDSQATLWEENTALTDEASKRYDTTASKIKIAYNEFNKLSIEVGDKVIPTLRDMLVVVRDVILTIDSMAGAITDAIADSIVSYKTFRREQQKALNQDIVKSFSQEWVSEFNNIADSTNRAMSKLKPEVVDFKGQIGLLGQSMTDATKAYAKKTEAVKASTKATKEAQKPMDDTLQRLEKLREGAGEVAKAKEEAAEAAQEMREELERVAESAYSAVTSSERYREILKEVKDGTLSQAEAYEKAADMTLDYQESIIQVAEAKEYLNATIADVNQGLKDPSAIDAAISNLDRLEKKQKDMLEGTKSGDKGGGFLEGLFGKFSGLGQVREGAFNDLGSSVANTIQDSIFSAINGNFGRGDTWRGWSNR